MAGKRIHVLPHPRGWQAKSAGATRPFRVGKTQEAMAAAAKEQLRRSAGGGEVVIHRRNGTIRDADTINRRDPSPPRG